MIAIEELLWSTRFPCRKTGRARRIQQRARRRFTPNLLDHFPARGGVIALIIFLGARLEGVLQYMQGNNTQLCNTLLPAYSFTTRSSAAERSIASISVWRVTARSKSASNPVPAAKACAARLYAWATLRGGPGGVPSGTRVYWAGAGISASGALPLAAYNMFGPMLKAPGAEITIVPARP